MFFNLLKSREDRQRDLRIAVNKARSAIIEATRAVSLCNELERSIPKSIAAMRSAMPHAPCLVSEQWCAAEDALSGREVFQEQRHAVEVLERLMTDIPAIRRHWQLRLSKLQS